MNHYKYSFYTIVLVSIYYGCEKLIKLKSLCGVCKVCVLGINVYHDDSSMRLIVDGELTSASDEERFRRIKRWTEFPLKAIKSCLELAGIVINQVGRFAVNNE